MRRPRAEQQPGGSLGLQMTPLIDVVFLLLSYFLFTLSLTMLEGVLPSKLALGEDQQEQQTDEPPPREVIVRIVQRGDRVHYFLDDWPITDFASLSESLERLSDDTLVVIDPAPGVTVAPVVRTYNQCLKIGLSRVVFPVASS
jgi:biopolymer transport protein ExbD